MGEKIIFKDGVINVPDNPIIAFIEGDGTGPDIWKATKTVIDAAVEKAYQGKKIIEWLEVLAGEKAFKCTGSWLPEESLQVLREYGVAIKGPLTTPIGGGFRSVNVALRQKLDLYACVRPAKWIKGVPSPVQQPELLNVVLFRENTEDIYAGIEWEAESQENVKIRDFLNNEMNCNIPSHAGIGIKYISKEATEKLMRSTLEYAIKNKRKIVTVVHKGNIMKYTEGYFKKWCFELAEKEYGDLIIKEENLGDYNGSIPEGKILLNDRITDNMFQQVLLRPKDYDVIITSNLNGDYLSDALAAQVGGLGVAPGANIGDNLAIFEATHGTAPKYAGLDKVNPSSLIMSGVMMLEYLGWNEAAALIENALEKTILQKTVTYDLARFLENAREVKTSEFAQAVVANM